MTNSTKDITDSHYVSLAEYAEKAYLEYAMSVVKGRALPSVSDGQKPVQRRILYAMKEMGLSHQTKPVKSARVVGEIIGKYHPHGDVSAYEAMVRMAQDFTLRYPLIDGIGNYGSRDGDTAAAMRYTEARLTSIAELLLAEIHLDTVDFINNYDGAFLEPVDLPARLPMILLNGASGIAVGLATEIPSHNLKEIAQACIALLNNPEIETKALMQYILGPDFATGGQIINSAEEILQIYTLGKGSVRVRSRYSVEKLARGQWRIIVHELPYGTSTQKILAQIEEQTNPKTKLGKKQLSQDQINTKSLILSILDKVRDESDSNEPIRLVFEPKSSRLNPDEFMNTLMVQTDLELNVSINLVMIGLDGLPQQKSLKQILTEWLSFRTTCVTRKLQYKLNQVEKRMHILYGRMTVFLNIDEVIAIIREADEPKTELMQRFKLSEIQTEDILEIRLRQLAKLEWLKMETELEELQQESKKLIHLLNNSDAKRQLIIEEIKADSKKFSDARITKIEQAERSILIQTAADEPITLILSQQGWIRSRAGHNLDLNLTSFKEGDRLKQILETRSIWPLIVMDSLGKSYTINAADIPSSGRGDGIPISSLIEMQANASIIAMMAGNPKQHYLLSSSTGYGFITSLENMTGRVKAGKSIITIGEKAWALPPIPINIEPNTTPGTYLIAVSNEPRLLAFQLAELKFLTKGKGLQLISLAKNQYLQYIIITQAEKYTLYVKGHKNISSEVFNLQDIINLRGKKGKIFKTNGTIVDISVTGIKK